MELAESIRKYLVYIHEFPNGKRYIGITCRSIQERFGKDGYGYHSQPLIYNAIKKYGWNDIKHIIVKDQLSKEEACALEKELIKKYDTMNHDKGYNITAGGDGHSTLTPEQEQEILELFAQGKSCADIGKIMQINRQTIPAILISYGYTKEDIIFQGHINAGQARKGYLNSEAIKLYQSGKNSQEIAEILDAHKTSIKRTLTKAGLSGQERWERSVEKDSKKVLQYDLHGNFIKEFSSIKEAARQMGNKNSSNISRAASLAYPKAKTAYGFIWKFKEDVKEITD